MENAQQAVEETPRARPPRLQPRRPRCIRIRQSLDDRIREIARHRDVHMSVVIHELLDAGWNALHAQEEDESR